jgi:hypothetical protein
VAGYGDAAGKVPGLTKAAMLIDIDLRYPGNSYTPQERQAMEKARDALLWPNRVVPI